MEKQQNQAGLILQYDKRRFDGGPEVEQIRLIEAQQAILKEQQQQTGQWHYAMPAPDSQASVSESVASTTATGQSREAPKAESGQSNKVRDAILVGPLSLGIGAVGIFTACLAIAVAYQMNNPVLLTQGRTVLTECGRTLRKGMLDTVSIPYRLLKAVSSRT